MRKVFLKVFLIIVSIVGTLYVTPANVSATEPASIEVTSGEEFTYEKWVIDGIVYTVVFNAEGSIVEMYPENCGGPHHGGH